MYQLERDKCVNVRVRQSTGECWKERILIQVLKGNAALCVSDYDKKRFYADESYDVTRWHYWTEIKEPEWKPFDKNEELEPYIDCWFRSKADRIQIRPVAYDVTDDVGVLRLYEMWYTKEVLFKNFEMKVDGKWVPVGKLDE